VRHHDDVEGVARAVRGQVLGGAGQHGDAVAAREYDRAMDNGRAWRVAIVGAGPSAFYAAEAVFKQAGDTARIDVFERLPTPFGLVRHGVAPDHQDVKNVTATLEKVGADPRVRFVGRLATYKYINMDAAVKLALALFEELAAAGDFASEAEPRT
jgi:NADPH-dependent glutamate synthase beta subunit-like oxidoreductase